MTRQQAKLNTSKANIFVIIMIGFVLQSNAALAIVDMKNANYVDSWLDFGDENFQLVRSYNSRSDYDGMFGFGWCSEFETRLRRAPDNSLVVTNCGAGQTENYVPSTTEFGKVWISRGDGQVTITYDGNRYVERSVAADLRPGQVNILREFNGMGRLSSYRLESGIRLWLAWSDGRLREIKVGDRVYGLRYNAAGKISEVSGVNGAKVRYFHGPGGVLEATKNMWENTYTYAYENKMLVRIGFPDGTEKKLAYDLTTRAITEFIDRSRNGAICSERYRYFDVDGIMHFYSTATKSCLENNEWRIVDRQYFEFVNAQLPNGEFKLLRSRHWAQAAAEMIDDSYNPQTGRRQSRNIYPMTEEPKPLARE